ncbi:unnamed protein product [Rotaria sordida]|uniref:TIR domain-containing protein n=1 Tax=Rotaria sordida TaxID=392033 RepID=A0A815NJR0_9BILA|nr:unnamed protein product [Rotaria sordida]CAF4141202.1 unnamed protein product [Rotaria sordida]
MEKQQKFDEAIDALSSINTDQVLCSPDSTTSLVLIEQGASRRLKDCLAHISDNQDCLKYIEKIGLFNRAIAIADTEDTQKIRIQSHLLFNREVLEILVDIVNALHLNDNFHRRDFILVLCTWLEAIVHFVHRHVNSSTEIFQSLRESILSCVLSDWYRIYLEQSPEMNIPARTFFVRTCSFLTGVFQGDQLSFENALKRAESYIRVISVGEQIFKYNLTNFRRYLSQSKNIENDTACLTGVCVLITNCFTYEAFRNDDAYFTLLLRLLTSDFVRTGLLSTWTNDSTILAGTIMSQLRDATNDATILLWLQQNHAATPIYIYCWAEKTVCKQIFENLIDKGYKVWFDEKDMHGSTLQAMANAIENSQCILICMSQNYEKSNPCHHEAEYAYVCNRRILPIVVQSKYKAKSWLGFLIGTRLYINFTKHEFDKAFEMLDAEIKHSETMAETTTKRPVVTDLHEEKAKQNDISAQPIVDPIVKRVEFNKEVPTMYEHKHVNEWTNDDVINWCRKHNLLVLSQLLEHYDGTSLLRLHNMSKTTGDEDMFRLLQNDCQQISANGKIELTLTEFIRFQSELDKRLEKDITQNKPMPEKKPKTTKFCSIL